MKNAVIFARVSSTNDRQSTKRQVSDLTKYANANELNVARVFEEHISGAKTIEERKVLQDCLAYCANNDVAVLLLSELSRLGRSPLQVLRAVDTLTNAGVAIYVQNIGICSTMPDGKPNGVFNIIVSVMAEMYRMERENIQYRLNSGREQYIANGGVLGRKQGSTKTDDDILNNPKYSDAIKRLKKGQTIRDIATCTNVSIGTVQKIRHILNNRGEL